VLLMPTQQPAFWSTSTQVELGPVMGSQSESWLQSAQSPCPMHTQALSLWRCIQKQPLLHGRCPLQP
jgi:hypothetical protein